MTRKSVSWLTCHLPSFLTELPRGRWLRLCSWLLSPPPFLHHNFSGICSPRDRIHPFCRSPCHRGPRGPLSGFRPAAGPIPDVCHCGSPPGLTSMEALVSVLHANLKSGFAFLSCRHVSLVPMVAKKIDELVRCLLSFSSLTVTTYRLTHSRSQMFTQSQ